MTVNWKSALLATLLFAGLETGHTIKCYDDCIYASGDVPAAGYKDITANCLNTKPKDCDPKVNNCYRETIKFTTPNKFEINRQDCGRETLTPENMKCAPMTAGPAASATQCNCAGDLCNRTTRTTVDSRLFLVLSAVCGAVRLLKGF
ncbi:uncharacterized protein LOC129601208 [Paramacrobiotus metropolitanus]|uniref:uncharacterized protein LOC129601208 n=1 Tax=Paramacrobiotus metropolitanus TaxID=2943436 RepID=UPI00244567E2|nr:uncharacterized protein LOC129601208 [Paramacrobiotus metropolitanus]